MSSSRGSAPVHSGVASSDIRLATRRWSPNRKFSLRTRGDVGLHGPITSRTTRNRARPVGQAACWRRICRCFGPHPTSGRAFCSNAGRAVLEELLLPAVENGGLQAEFIAELRDRLILQQMPPEDGNLCFRRVVLPLLLHAFSPLPYRENAFSISS